MAVDVMILGNRDDARDVALATTFSGLLNPNDLDYRPNMGGRNKFGEWLTDAAEREHAVALVLARRGAIIGRIEKTASDHEFVIHASDLGHRIVFSIEDVLFLFWNSSL